MHSNPTEILFFIVLLPVVVL
uniref:Uncharacterized protein n=1 Tax=Arundo donax TaxID=35708 RepID=A0A0A9EN84_ARUDO